MSFNFHDLNKDTRSKMLDEIKNDVSKNNLCFSKRFSQKGIVDYPDLLNKHVQNGNEVSLGEELKIAGRLNTMEQTSRGPRKVPVNAHETFAESEFNRFYIRALCIIAIESKKELEVYRAKTVTSARSESQAKIGMKVDPIKVLSDLRSNIGVDTTLGLPPGPNSGLSVKLV